MKKLSNAFSYANVVATLALFLAISGGVVYAASTLGHNAVKSKNIAAHAVRTRNIARSAVKNGNLAANAISTAKVRPGAITGGKVKAGTLTRTNLAAGTLAGLQTLDVSNSVVPGLTTESTGGTTIPLTGTATFTPAAGKSYEILTELAGTPTDGSGEEGGPCAPFVLVLVNGVPFTGTSIYDNNEGTPPFNKEPVGSSSTAIGLQQAGQQQTISALSFGDSDCTSATTASLRVTVVEFG